MLWRPLGWFEISKGSKEVRGARSQLLVHFLSCRTIGKTLIIDGTCINQEESICNACNRALCGTSPKFFLLGGGGGMFSARFSTRLCGLGKCSVQFYRDGEIQCTCPIILVTLGRNTVYSSTRTQTKDHLEQHENMIIKTISLPDIFLNCCNF